MGKILIIDDDKGVCLTLSRMIQKEGHAFRCVHTLKEGVAEAEADAYDLVFLDVMMPDGSGLDILRKIKETPSRPEVILSTVTNENN